MKVPRLNRLSDSDRVTVEQALLHGRFESFRKLSLQLRQRYLLFISPSALCAHRQRLLARQLQQQGEQI